MKITTDHDTIRAWAQARGAVPAELTSPVRAPGILHFRFPDQDGSDDVSWGAFFEKFEHAGLAFVFDDVEPDGKLSTFYQLVSRAVAPD